MPFMPTKIGLSLSFRPSPFGVKAVGIRMSACDLYIFIVILSDEEHDSAFTKRVYITESTAEFTVTIGFGIVVLLNPEAGFQRYVWPPVAYNCSGWPTTATVSFPAKAFIGGNTVIKTVSLAGLVHPMSSLAVSIYEVVFAGVAMGCNELIVVRLASEFHKKDAAVVIPFNNNDVPKQMMVSV